MIIVNVKGGAGNQLFQASHLYTISRDENCKIYLRTKALGNYGEKQDLFTHAWEMFDWRMSSSLASSILIKLSRVALLNRLFGKVGIICVDGYFQNDFNLDYAALALQAISAESDTRANFAEVVLHCRGGDYLHPPNDEIYCQVTAEDFEYVIKMADTDIGNLHVTGNHSKVISILEAKGASVNVGSINDDLNLMADAKTVICSNSTFAFWGAVFSLIRGGKIFVPKRYYQTSADPNPFDFLVRNFPDQVTRFEN